MGTQVRAQHAEATALGAVLGLLFVWLNRTQQPVPDAEGLVAAVYVPPTPTWMYLGAATLGAVLALFLSLAVAEVRARVEAK